MTARTATTASRLLLGGTLLLAGGLLLAGCTSAPDPTPTPTNSPSPSPSPAETATTPPTESEAPAPEPEPVTCDAVLTPEATSALAEQGLELREGTTPGYPLAEQFAAAGGTACTWSVPQSDIFFTVVQLPVADGEQEAWARVLAENDYTPTDDPVPGAHTGPVEPGTGIASIAIVEPTRITFMSAPAHATDLAPAP